MAAPAPYQLELGPDVAYVQRLSESPSRGASVQSALAPGMLGRAYLWPWLGVTVRYTRALHELSLDPMALDTSAPSLEPAAKMMVTTLQGAIQPTWMITPQFRFFASVGAGWGSVIAPSIRLLGEEQGAALSSIRQRRGVLLELPLGVGLGWWVLPRWINLSYEASFAPTFRSSGDVNSRDSYVNERGNSAVAAPMPRFKGSAYHHLSIALTL